jgi:hypothetical protein
LLALAPLAIRLTPLLALVILSGVLVVLIGFETVRFAAVRDSVRHSPATPA